MTLDYNISMNEIIFIDKPSGWTSFDVVAKIRSALSKKWGKRIKVGHSGTLDPFATGLLIILTGQETKNQAKYMKLDKEYHATLKLGATSTTGDPEGKITKIVKNGPLAPTKKEVEGVLTSFVGEVSQTPPAFSAVKIDGKRAYKLAREGKEVKLEPRKIKIYTAEIMEYEYPDLKIRVSCSSGTYIRTLAENIGEKLKTGAYLSALRRTKIGDYLVDDAKKVGSIIEEMGKE